MPLTMNDLSISPDGVDLESLLAEWRWAMPEPMQPVLLTAMGDLFSQASSGNVYFVDTVEGTIRLVARDGQSFQKLMTDNQFVTDHFFPSRIVQLRNVGKTLKPHQVYSHIKPLVLGGEDNLDNIEITDVAVHVSLHGQIHRQVKDLPDGTPIDKINLD